MSCCANVNRTALTAKIKSRHLRNETFAPFYANFHFTQMSRCASVPAFFRSQRRVFEPFARRDTCNFTLISPCASVLQPILEDLLKLICQIVGIRWRSSSSRSSFQHGTPWRNSGRLFLENILIAGRIIDKTWNRIEENRNESVLRVEIGEYSSHARNGEAISRSEIYVASSRSC